MKQLLALMVVALTATTAHSQVLTNIDPRNAKFINIERERLGSGVQGLNDYERAHLVLDNDIYHEAQYLPYHPTAATIWPRVIEVDCIKATPLKCEGYHWLPAMGRAEYLFVTPRFREVPKPVLVPFIVQGPERIILKEVPIKPKKE